MRCVICKQGETRRGATSASLQRGGAILVVRNVPAEICENCGEVYLDEQVAQELLSQAELCLAAGVLVSVKDFGMAA